MQAQAEVQYSEHGDYVDEELDSLTMQIFNEFDADGSGTIDAKELYNFLKDIATRRG